MSREAVHLQLPDEVSTPCHVAPWAYSGRMEEQRLARVLAVVDGFDEAARRDRAYWHARSAAERLRHVQILRRSTFGEDRASAPLQRVLEGVGKTGR